jgi:hypothetical protein
MHPRLSTTVKSSSQLRAVTRHLFSRDAEYDRERLSWRCVDRRREEPAARRRATDGPHSADASDVLSVRPSQRSTKPLAVLHRSSGQRRPTWVMACAALFPAGSAEELCGHRLRHSSKRCSPLIKDDWIETVVSPRAVFRGDLHAFLPSKIDRGACVAPWRARRTSVQAEVEKSISHGAPSASAVKLFFSLTSCHSGPKTTSKIRGPGSAKSRLDGRMVTRERCLSSIEPEASSETGSFRRRAPVAASSSADSGRKRLE